MSIRPPALDDRNFDDLVQELLSRVPAHNPEWSPRPGDPGWTLVELFAWLTDTLLYRANLIPERQRLAFLRLLGEKMRPATPARGLISLEIANPDNRAFSLQPLATVKGAVNFETRTEVTVFPVAAETYYKRPLTETESRDLADVVAGLKQIYNLKGAATPYVTAPIFAGMPEVEGFNLIERTVDGCLWLALLAPDSESVEVVRQTLGTGELGGQPLLSVGVMPAIAVPALFEEISSRAQIPHVWEISTGREILTQPEYLPLTVTADSTAGLTRQGVVRLALPAAQNIGALSNNVRQNLFAGTGDRPPRLDVPEKADRVVAWLRLRPTRFDLQNFSLSWVGINAVEIDQRQTIQGRIIGESNGYADQEFQLPGQSVESETLQIQVEETDRGYQLWQQVDDLALVGRDTPAYSLDSEAGTIRFGDGVRGKIPEVGKRIRVLFLRAGGGSSGNLPPGSLTEIRANDLQGKPIATQFKVLQPLALAGGEDAETLADAERRIPELFRHRDRAVTSDDYRQLAALTPSIRLGRVEILPRFKPHQRRSNVPGVVSVIVLPLKEAIDTPNPRPDRPMLEAVHAYLDARRPLATELYVIGCEYIPLGIGVGVRIAAGFGRDAVLSSVREAVRRFLWSLPPGGIDGRGWQLGKTVQDRELAVIVARVPGVSSVLGVNLFRKQGNNWQKMIPPGIGLAVELTLEAWQLPELLSVVVLADEPPPEDLSPQPFTSKSGIAVPVVLEVC